MLSYAVKDIKDPVEYFSSKKYSFKNYRFLDITKVLSLISYHFLYSVISKVGECLPVVL